MLKKSAPEKINKISIETSLELIKKLIGAEVNNSSVSAIVNDLSKKNRDNYFSLNSFLEKGKLMDAVGAGDALLAYSSLSLKLSNCLISSAIIGSLAASCACEMVGNEPINSEKVLKKLKEVKIRLRSQ